MGSETVLARVNLPDSEALTFCEALKSLIERADLQPDLIVLAKTDTGEVFRSLALVEETLSDGSLAYSVIVRLG